MLEKDPTVFLVKPDKSSKSYAWLANCFSLIYHNNIKQNYVYCKVCSNLITYNSIHGTGSLLRHNCYRKKVNSLNVDNATDLNLQQMMPIPKKIGIRSPQMATSESNQSVSMNSSAISPIAITRQKKDIEELIAKGDPSIEMKSPLNIKSDVWSNGNFKIIYKDGIKLHFVQCLYCNALITYRSKTGTASLLRHSCMKKINAKKMIKPELISGGNSDEIEVMTLPISEVSQIDDAVDITTGSGDGLTYEQYVPSEFPEEFKEEASKLLQYFSYKDMQPTNIQNKKGFLSFGQYLINIGAEYGKVNIENILEGRNNSSLGENFLNILQKMLKPKFDEHKIALSCDYWHDPNRKSNFLTLYGYFIDDLFELKKVNLGTVSFMADFSAIDYKQLIVSILENYFANETEAETFLAKTTTVIFDEMGDSFKTYSSITCSCMILNRIVQQLIKDCNFGDFVPNEILNSDNWSSIWDYLENMPSDSVSNINELMSILNPFTQALKSLSSDQKPTINEVYIFRKKLEDHFKNVNFTNENARTIALTLLRENFPMTSVHKIAVFLDPRFKSLKFMSREEKANVINMVSKMLTADDTGNNVIAFNDESDSPKTGINSSGTQNPSQISDCADSTKYLIEYMDINEERDDTHDEIESYLNLKFNDIYSANILEFWESRYDLPQLRQLAKEILCIPATSIASERIFSEDANLFIKRRLNMEIENVKQMIYIHENFEMLSNVL